jgi:hypothetical protein
MFFNDLFLCLLFDKQRIEPVTTTTPHFAYGADDSSAVDQFHSSNLRSLDSLFINE